MAAGASTDIDARWMSLALSLGRRGMGRVWPNPAVGCVIVQGDRVVGRGWTQDGGRPHAEVVALQQAGQTARGATAYVTLEPCAHTGKTGPCCDALIAAGVSRVVVAIGDPDPRVAGQGLDRMCGAGVEVTTGVLAEDSLADHKGFLKRVTHGRPMVTLKLAMSVDGRIATASGESQWITGPEARREVHALRARHDAVMVGAGTARADMPSLTVRGLGIDRQPLRVVLSNDLALPQSGPLFETARDIPVWLVHGTRAATENHAAWTEAGAELLSVPSLHVDVGAALALLGQAGLTRVFCEGGGRLAASLLDAGLVDELVVFSAGIALGAEGLPGLSGLSFAALAEAPRFKLAGSRQIGADVMQRWVLGRSAH